MIDKEKVRTLYKAGINMGAVAKEFGVSRQRIQQIVKDLVHTIVRWRPEFTCKHCNLPFHAREGNTKTLRCSDCIHRERIERKQYWSYNHKLHCCPQCGGTKYRYVNGVCSNCNLKNKYNSPGAFRENRLTYANAYAATHVEEQRIYRKQWFKRMKDNNPERYQKYLDAMKKNGKKRYDAIKADPVKNAALLKYYREKAAQRKLK